MYALSSGILLCIASIQENGEYRSPQLPELYRLRSNTMKHFWALLFIWWYFASMYHVPSETIRTCLSTTTRAIWTALRNDDACLSCTLYVVVFFFYRVYSRIGRTRLSTSPWARWTMLHNDDACPSFGLYYVVIFFYVSCLSMNKANIALRNFLTYIDCGSYSWFMSKLYHLSRGINILCRFPSRKGRTWLSTTIWPV